MKNNNKLKKSLLSVFTILATAAIFLLLNHKILDTGMCWYAFAVIMVSEIVLSFIWVTHRGIPQRFAVVIISCLQTVVNIIVSSIFVKFLPNAYIVFSVYTIASFTVLVVLSFYFYRASAVSEKNSNAKAFFQDCRLMVNAIALSPNGQAHREELLKLEENIRFCNDGVMLDTDKEIYEAICNLKVQVADGGDNIHSIIENIDAMLIHHDSVAKCSNR